MHSTSEIKLERIYTLLHDQLRLPDLNEGQKHILGSAINTAITAYHNEEDGLGDKQQTELLKKIEKHAAALEKLLNTYVDDSQLHHLSFVAKEPFNVIRLQNDMASLKCFSQEILSGSSVSSYLNDRMFTDYDKSDDFIEIDIHEKRSTTRANTMTQNKLHSKTSGFLMMVLWLKQGFDEVFTEKTIEYLPSPPETAQFLFSRDGSLPSTCEITLGDCISYFGYLVYAVELTARGSISYDQYGRKVRLALKEIEKFENPISFP